MEADTAAEPEVGPWKTELLDVVRAASGGLLFGVPLLYTMEVWWTGTHTTPALMLVVLGVLVLPVLALNRTAGFRSHRDVRLRDAVGDTVEAIAVGVVVTAIVLLLVGEIGPDSGGESALGKVVYECVPFCLGVGVARHFLHGRRAGGEGEGEDASPGDLGAVGGGDAAGGSSEDGDDDLNGGLSPTVADLGATILGAIFVSLSIAPTDEVPMIASAVGPIGLLALIGASIATSYAIVFVAEFGNQEARHTQEGPFQRPITETVVSYLLALCVAAALLWLFQRGTDPPADLLARVVVLGFPAAIGGAAGRLAV
ncbi:MAG TPA: TIGR02587 family membrane protein [Acidimicrobiales bacterium]|nr:TIGR02587 family membrane protein [Acidimicrobiales bacterium]